MPSTAFRSDGRRASGRALPARDRRLTELVRIGRVGRPHGVDGAFVVEEASEVGATRVLGRLGLGDASAQDDIDELRELLAAWRAAKAATWKAAVEWLVRGLLALLLIGIAVRLGVPELLK